MGIAAHWCGSLVGNLGQWSWGLPFQSSQAVHSSTTLQSCTSSARHVFLSSSSASVFALQCQTGGGQKGQKGHSGPRYTLLKKPWGAEDASCLLWRSICKPHLRCRAGWALLQGSQVFSCPNVGWLVLHKTLKVAIPTLHPFNTVYFLPLVSIPRHNTAWALLLIHCGIIFPLEY